MPMVPTKILLLEDNPGDARLLREALAEITAFQPEINYCETLRDALETVAAFKPDIVLSDLELPDAQGLDAVRRLHDAAPDIPIVVLSALDDESMAIRSLQEGAQDYLVKGRIDGQSVWHALRYAVERQRVQMRALDLAFVDDLTGLNNRKGFLRLAQHHVKLAYRTGAAFSIGFFDLDGLKQINDTYGHQEGNHALIDASNILKDSFRQTDVLGRLGGDEFAAIISDATPQSAEIVRRRIQQKLNALNAKSGRLYDLSFSIGIVTPSLAEPREIGALLDSADDMMYRDKRLKSPTRPSVLKQASPVRN